MQIGQNIRRKRLDMGLTQSELADRSGVSKAMICDVEADKKNPTIKVVGQLAAGLDCTISDLLDLEDRPRFVPCRRDQHRVLVDPETGIERRLHSPVLVRRGVEILEYVYPPGTGMADFPPHPSGTIEHATVLEGRARVIVGEDSIDLDADDSVTYEADREHGAINLGEGVTRVLFVQMSPERRK